jgi:hypothetical protein
MFRLIDDFLRERATKFGHALQRLTGLTCYFVARAGIFLCVLSIIIEFINYFHRVLAYPTPIHWLWINGILIFVLVKRSIDATKADEHIGSNVKPAFLLWYHASLQWNMFWRLIWLALALWSFGDIWVWPNVLHVHQAKFFLLQVIEHMGYPWGMTIFSYFIVADPLPPGTSKIREWLSSFGVMPQLARQENNS